MSTFKPLPYEEALDRAGYGKLQWYITFAGALCILCSYVAVSNISFILPSSQCDLELTSQGKGALITSGFTGIILSSHLWGFLSDTLGRRYILTRCLAMDGILYIITSFVPNFWVFLAMRFLNGFSSCGGVVSAWAYIGEFHTDRYRTRAIMIASVIGATIYFLLPCLAWLVLPLPIQIPIIGGLVYKSWRLFYFLCGIPSLITSAIMILLPESPKFLLARGEKSECIKILQYIYTKNTGNPPEELLISNVELDDNEKITKTDGDPYDISVFLHKMWVQTVPLFKKPLHFNFFILCTMQFILYFCNNGLYLWIPETVNRIATYRDNNPNQPGTFCLAVENYLTTSTEKELLTPAKYVNDEYKNNSFLKIVDDEEESIIECDDSIDFSVYEITVLLGVFSVIGLIAIMVLMKVFPRKLVLATGLITNIIATFCLIFLYELDFILSIVIVMIVSTGCAIPVVTSAVVDHFPTNLRAMAVCLTLLTGRLGTIVSSQIVGSILDIHCNIILYCFAVMIAICVLLLSFLPRSHSKHHRHTEDISLAGRKLIA